MTLRTKLVAALGLLSAIATLALGAWTYQETGRNLRNEIDRSLDGVSDAVTERLAAYGPEATPAELARAIDGEQRAFGPAFDDQGGSTGGDDDRDGHPRPGHIEQIIIQVTNERGDFYSFPSSRQLLATPQHVSRQTVAGYAHDYGDVEINGGRFRMLTAPVGFGRQIQVARSLDSTERVLHRLREKTMLAVALVSAAAGGLGWLIARQVTRRLTILTLAAEDVARTGRLDVEVPVHGRDEAGRLSEAFSGMLGALARSRDDQQRLVQDAGHELRTPLTSLRTNIATLRRHEQMEPEVRQSVLSDLDTETKELTTLVNELVELATDRYTDEPIETVGLGDIAAGVAERTTRRTGRAVTIDADGSAVDGQRGALERAVSNLVDNAVKFDASGSAPIEVVISHGRVEVNDRGPGVPTDDLDRIFDRFHRAVTARSRPGSGLGLSIVREIAERHGGTVFASNRDGGGASIGFVLPRAFQTNSHPIDDRLMPDSTMMDPAPHPSSHAAPTLGETSP